MPRPVPAALLAAGLLAGLGATGVLAGSDARAEPDAPAPRVTMMCEHADGPGRVRCEVEATAPPGGSITWGDVVLVATPPFASALRGRIGPRDATVHVRESWRWAMAIVARSKGSGDIECRVRLVVCQSGKGGPADAAPTCSAREVPATGHLVVGE